MINLDLIASPTPLPAPGVILHYWVKSVEILPVTELTELLVAYAGNRSTSEATLEVDV